jgi:methylenetetrahydrofolate dehydrogenase (NADP+)/methenyltetrahydrofolate cyclohydrolase
MKIFDGKKAAAKILNELKADIKKTKRLLAIAVILVGDNEASKLYIELKKKAAAKVGIDVKEYIFSHQVKEEEIIAKIEELNKDKKVNGIIVQLPLPAVFNADKIIESIEPNKDVDGFHKENRRRLEKGEKCLWPVMPMAILLAIQAALKNNFKDKKILALVNSEVFGQTLQVVLKQHGAEVEYLVRNTCIVLGAEKEVKAADVLIIVCGCPNFIKQDVIKENAVLIDCGITRFHDGKVVGDVDKESVKNKASFLTPVPGGVGPLTVALLLGNVLLATKIAYKKSK